MCLCPPPIAAADSAFEIQLGERKDGRTGDEGRGSDLKGGSDLEGGSEAKRGGEEEDSATTKGRRAGVWGGKLMAVAAATGKPVD